jgi:phage-related protein
MKRVPAIFYRTETGNEPVRQWLKAMSAEDRRRIGEDLKTVEFGWPLGMPLCKSLGGGLHEVRTDLTDKRTARIFFYIDRLQRLVVLHGVVKKTRKTRAEDIALARANKSRHERSIG